MTSNVEKTFIDNVTAYITQDEKANMTKGALLASCAEMGVTPKDIKGKGKYRAALKASMSTLFIGTRELAKAEKAVKAGKNADDIAVVYVAAFTPKGQKRTETYRYLQRDVSSRLAKIAASLEKYLEGDTGNNNERSKKNRSGINAIAHNTATIWAKASKLATSQVEQMTKTEREIAANWAAKDRAEFAAALKTALRLIPASVRKAEGIKIS